MRTQERYILATLTCTVILAAAVVWQNWPHHPAPAAPNSPVMAERPDTTEIATPEPAIGPGGLL